MERKFNEFCKAMEAWIRLSLKSLSVTCVMVASLSLTQEVAGQVQILESF